jgi:pyrimidine-nucleoside phosphorylase
MIPAEIIKKKRDGAVLSHIEIQEFVGGFVSGSVADYQMSALLMAVFLKGMDKTETLALTQAMLHSGVVIDLSNIKSAKVDKHSTGGVGDKTSLIIGPLVAAAGVSVPMISGRGLGHTGGTLDKLESIPGFNTQLSIDKFKDLVGKHGVCFIGQTKEICPADKRMYALRDVTATVECIPLICASIMSKKLAEGIDGLVLDVKTGSGAFMKSLSDAKILAKGLVDITRGAKKRVTALITDMNQPLGLTIGNALEVEECLEVLNNMGPSDLRELSLELAAHMIVIGGKAKNLDAARKAAEDTLKSGRAMDKFIEIVGAQGGALELPKADQKKSLTASKSGYVSEMDVEKIGIASLSLGAGRMKAEDKIDMAAGIVMHKKIGDHVTKGEPLATFFYSTGRDTSSAEELFKSAVMIRLQNTKAPRLIKEIISSRK